MLYRGFAPAPGSPKHAVIVSHPDPDSFTMSVARTYCAAVEARGQVAVLRDLYRMNFDPVLKASERPGAEPFTPAADVASELDQLAGTAAFVLVYPIWFGTPPAILKGYIERVLGAGTTVETISRRLQNPPHPLLGGKQLLSFSSSGASQRWLEGQGQLSSLRTIIDGYLARAFWMSTPEHVHFESIHEEIAEEDVRAHLTKVSEQANAMCDRLARERSRTSSVAAGRVEPTS